MCFRTEETRNLCGQALKSGDSPLVVISGDIEADRPDALENRHQTHGNKLLRRKILDPAEEILGFQIIPTANNIAVSFVFGSEDYNDLVNSGFPTDVFGLFVNGVNYGLVPGTGTAISAQTVNCGSEGLFGFASGIGAQNCSLYRDNPAFFGSIDSELDGLTTLLTLTIPVNLGQVNSIVFGIADAFDGTGSRLVVLRRHRALTRLTAVARCTITDDYRLRRSDFAATRVRKLHHAERYPDVRNRCATPPVAQDRRGRSEAWFRATGR